MFVWKAPEHKRGSKVNNPCEESNKSPVAFDTEFLRNYFDGKTQKRLNLRSRNLTSPHKERCRLNLLQIQSVEHVLADDNCLQLSDFQNFPNLSILSLRSNKLHHLQTSQSRGSGDQNHFKCLSRLDLSFNRLESNSLNYLNQLKALVELRLNSNQIKFFTDATNLSNLSKLVRLELCANGIESCKIFHHLSSLQNLHELVLNNNHLRRIPFLLRSETAEKLNQLTGKEGKTNRNASKGSNKSLGKDSILSSEYRTSCDDTASVNSNVTRSSSSIESEICYLLNNVYHPQTRDVLSSFRPRTLSTLYEGSEHETSSSEQSTTSSETEDSQVADEVIPIGHVPFPRLQSLYIKFNEFRTERSILGASLWPNMKEVYIRGNHVADNVQVFDIFARSKIIVHYK